MKQNLKQNLKNSSFFLLKCLLPELQMDWDNIYFYIKNNYKINGKK